jgi:hypothetical protein
MANIYLLYKNDGSNTEVPLYIGVTTYTLTYRLKQHIREAKRGHQTNEVLIKELLSPNIRIKLIDRGSISLRHKYIKLYKAKGHILLNKYTNTN